MLRGLDAQALLEGAIQVANGDRCGVFAGLHNTLSSMISMMSNRPLSADYLSNAFREQFAGVRRVFGGRAAPRRYRWGDEVLPGMTAVKASGHTPGMSALEIVSGDAAMMYVADITNPPSFFCFMLNSRPCST